MRKEPSPSLQLEIRTSLDVKLVLAADELDIMACFQPLDKQKRISATRVHLEPCYENSIICVDSLAVLHLRNRKDGPEKPETSNFSASYMLGLLVETQRKIHVQRIRARAVHYVDVNERSHTIHDQPEGFWDNFTISRQAANSYPSP